MSNVNHSDWYSNVFKGWDAKRLGTKPTAEMLQSIHGLQARPGKQALACAMALRPEGVTAGQIVIACGAPQLNKMRGFITDALLKRQAVAPSSEGHTVYKLELTAKGKQRIERTEKAAAAKAAEGAGETAPKGKGKAKTKKPVKARTQATVTAEAAQAINDAVAATDTPVEQPAA